MCKCRNKFQVFKQLDQKIKYTTFSVIFSSMITTKPLKKSYKNLKTNFKNTTLNSKNQKVTSMKTLELEHKVRMTCIQLTQNYFQFLNNLKTLG